MLGNINILFLLIAWFCMGETKSLARKVTPDDRDRVSGSKPEGHRNVIQEALDQTPEPSDFACPRGIDSLAEEDQKKSGVFTSGLGKTVATNCIVDFDPFNDALDFEKALNKFEETQIPLMKPDHLDKCYQDQSPSYAKDRIADYYVAQLTLIESSRSLVDALTATDLILGTHVVREIWDDHDHDFFWKFYLPGIEGYVRKTIFDCQTQYADPKNPGYGTVAFRNLIAKTKFALDLHRAIQSKIASGYITPERSAKIQSDLKSRAHWRHVPASHDFDRHENAYDKIEEDTHDVDAAREKAAASSARELLAADKFILSQAPWLEGKEMKSLLKKRNVSEWEISQALGLQLQNNQRLLREKLFKVRHAAQCLYFDKDLMEECRDVLLSTMNEVPVFDSHTSIMDSADHFPEADRKARYGIVSRFNAARCRMMVRSIKKNYDDSVDGFVNDMVFLAVTLGLGEVVSGSKALIAAGRVTRLSTGAEIARAIIWGSDATNLFLAGNEAVKVCDDALNRRMSKFPARESMSRNSPSCSQNSGQDAQAISEASTCYMAAAGAAIGVLPALPGTLKILKGISREGGITTLSSKLRSEVTEEVTRIFSHEGGTEVKLGAQRKLKVLEVLDHLTARRFVEGDESKSLPQLLAQMEKVFGDSLDTRQAAKFLDGLDGDAFKGFSQVISKASSLMKSEPTLGRARALERALDHAPDIANLAGPNWKQETLGCLTGLIVSGVY